MSIGTSLPEMFCWTEPDWSRLEILASQNPSLKERHITMSVRMGAVQCIGVSLFIQCRTVVWWFLMWLWALNCIFLLYIGLQLSVWKTTNFPLPLMFGLLGSHYMRSSLTVALIRALQRYRFNGSFLLCETRQKLKCKLSVQNIQLFIWSLQKFNEMLKKGLTMTPALLLNLLEKHNRLPFPQNCPQTVTSYTYLWKAFWTPSDIHTLHFLYQQVRMIMEKCWAAEPAKRPSFTSLHSDFRACT